MGRSPCCDKVGLKKGAWTPKEDQKLLNYVQQHGHGSWQALPPKAGLLRCGKSCRLRWTNYLRPDIKRGNFSLQEERTIIQLHALLGNRWSAIASHLPKRTDNEIKNYWSTHLKKRLIKMGIDPITHKPKNHALTTSGQSKDIANLSHMVQWESARLEAEARIVRESKLVSSNSVMINKAPTSATATTPPTPHPPCLDILKVWQQALMTKPRKDNVPSMIAQGLLASCGSLESPTSILNFADNILTTSSIGLVLHQNNLVRSSYSVPLNTCAIGKTGMNDYDHNEHTGKGIMDNSLQLDDNINGNPINSSYNTIDSLRIPSFFLESFEDLPGPSNTEPEHAIKYVDDKNNYWSNIISVVNSPMDTLGVI